MSNSIMMRLIKCLSVILLVIGCVQPTSVQAYSPVLTETVQNTNNTNNASVTVQRKEQPKQNTLELFVITVLVTILILFFVGVVHKDLRI